VNIDGVTRPDLFEFLALAKSVGDPVSPEE